MRSRVILLTSMLLVSVLSVRSEELPELSEWWSIEAGWSFGRDFSYLPDFDTANGGKNTLAIYTRRDVDDTLSSTWYNRFYQDTVNKFSWPSGEEFSIAYGDFDNDGVRDYLSHRGFIYKGITNCTPPAPTAISDYPSSAVAPYESRIITDVNNDGYMDAINPKSSEGGNFLFSILLGGPDLQKLKVTYVKKRPEHGYGEYFLGAFSKQPGDSTIKIVNMSYEYVTVNNVLRKKWDALVLREMRVQNVGDTVTITFTTLDSLWFKGYTSGYEMSYSASKVFTNHLAAQEYVFAREFRNNTPYLMAYEVVDNKLIEVADFSTPSISTEFLFNDINGDGYSDWAVFGWDYYVYFYRGLREGVDSLPFARYRLDADRFSRAANFTMLGIGDVTGDNVGDIAIGYDVADGHFAIIKGEYILPVGVAESVAGYARRTFDMLQNYPNPVGIERKTSLPITVEALQSFSLDLYTLQGSRIARLYQGQLPAGAHTLDIDMSIYQLPPGFYLLRLSGDGATRERAILLH